LFVFVFGLSISVNEYMIHHADISMYNMLPY
jgi:hypothetical protein